MWSMHIQSEFSESFEESYHLHPCIKIWIIFPKTSLGNSNEFLCEFCTYTFGYSGRVKNHICCLHVSETWTILKGKFWYFNCFKCKVCTNRFIYFGALKEHVYCNHAWIFELFPKASFGISNNFGCELCTKTFRFGVKMKNHIWNLNHSQRQVLEIQLFQMWSMH